MARSGPASRIAFAPPSRRSSRPIFFRLREAPGSSAGASLMALGLTTKARDTVAQVVSLAAGVEPASRPATSDCNTQRGRSLRHSCFDRLVLMHVCCTPRNARQNTLNPSSAGAGFAGICLSPNLNVFQSPASMLAWEGNFAMIMSRAGGHKGLRPGTGGDTWQTCRRARENIGQRLDSEDSMLFPQPSS
jgi:hypothetical protein